MKKRFKNFKKNAFVLFVIIVSVLVSLVSPMLSVSEYVSATDNNNLANIYPSKMTKLKLTSVYSGQLVDNTVNTTQSFVMTDKYFVAVQAQSAKENAGWIIATDIKKPNSKPVWKTKYNIGHGNGATWNSRTNQIVIIDKDIKIYFDANTGKFIKKESVGPVATGIAYDSDDDMYVQTNGSEKGSGQILTKNFQLIKSFDAKHRLVNQDVGYYGGYIYRIGYGGCNYLDLIKRKDDAAYCRKYFGESSNVIYQFDMQGDYVKAYYIEAGFNELESLDFASDGTMYLMFNNKPKKGYYAVYKATNFKAEKKLGIVESREMASVESRQVSSVESREIASVDSVKSVGQEIVANEQNAALVERLNALFEQEENANGRLDAKAEENGALAGRTIAEVEPVKVDGGNSEETKQVAKVEQMKKKTEQATSVDAAEERKEVNGGVIDGDRTVDDTGTVNGVEAMGVSEVNNTGVSEEVQIAKASETNTGIEVKDKADVEIKTIRALDGMNRFINEINKVVSTFHDYEKKNIGIDNDNGSNSTSIDTDVNSDAHDDTNNGANVISDISYVIIKQISSGLVKKAQDNLVQKDKADDNVASSVEPMVGEINGNEIARESDEDVDKNADMWDVEVAKTKGGIDEEFDSSNSVLNTSVVGVETTNNYDMVRKVVTIIAVIAGLLAVGWFVMVIVKNIY